MHKDSSFDHPLCPYYFIANVPLCDFTADNGATEFWLGSHAQTSVGDQQTAPHDGGGGVYSNKLYGPGAPIPWIAEEPLAQRRAVRPPCQPEARRGDVVIRDLRTWHAGMPNPSSAHRVMLGLGYQVGLSSLRVGDRGAEERRGEGAIACALADRRACFSPRALTIRTTKRGSTCRWRCRISSWDVQRGGWRSGPTFIATRSLPQPRPTRILISVRNMRPMSR